MNLRLKYTIKDTFTKGINWIEFAWSGASVWLQPNVINAAHFFQMNSPLKLGYSCTAISNYCSIMQTICFCPSIEKWFDRCTTISAYLQMKCKSEKKLQMVILNTSRNTCSPLFRAFLFQPHRSAVASQLICILIFFLVLGEASEFLSLLWPTSDLEFSILYTFCILHS